MLIACLDSGASKAGLVGLRVTRHERGVLFACLRHGHIDLEMDGDGREETAVDTLIALANWALARREGDEPIVFAVEGVEGHVYKGRSATSLFDTADQAGFTRGVLRMWARSHGLPRGAHSVVKITASRARAFFFGKDGRSAGDNEVVTAVGACVSGMPPLSVPVPDSRRPEYAAMHAYDAALVGLVVVAQALKWKAFPLPRAAQEALATLQIERKRREGEKKVRDAVKAAGVVIPKPKRVVSRGSRRRIREGVKASAARRA